MASLHLYIFLGVFGFFYELWNWMHKTWFFLDCKHKKSEGDVKYVICYERAYSDNHGKIIEVTLYVDPSFITEF